MLRHQTWDRSGIIDFGHVEEAGMKIGHSMVVGHGMAAGIEIDQAAWTMDRGYSRHRDRSRRMDVKHVEAVVM